jgi:hypothetical protein
MQLILLGQGYAGPARFKFWSHLKKYSIEQRRKKQA